MDADLQNRFLKWFDSLNPKSYREKVFIENFESTGRGLGATVDLQVGDWLMTVDPKCILSECHDTINSNELYQLLREQPWYEEDTSIVNLALVLFIERLRGEESFFATYIETIPHSYDSLVYWSEEELSWLEYSGDNLVNEEEEEEEEDVGRDEETKCFATDAHVVVAIQNTEMGAELKHRLSLLHIAFQHYIAPFLEQNGILRANNMEGGDDDLDDTNDHIAVWTTHDGRDAFAVMKWALATVWSRGYWYNDVACLVPLADLFNHGGSGLAAFGSIAELNNQRRAGADFLPSDLDLDDPTLFRIVTNVPVSKGEQIFISYGSVDRELLSDYGFILKKSEEMDEEEEAIAEQLPHWRAARGACVMLPLCVELLHDTPRHARPLWPLNDDDQRNEENDDNDDDDAMLNELPDANPTLALASGVSWRISGSETTLPIGLLCALRWAAWRGDDSVAVERLKAAEELGEANDTPAPSSSSGVLSLDNELHVVTHLVRVCQSWLAACPALPRRHTGSGDAMRFQMAQQLREGERAVLCHLIDLCHVHWQTLLHNSVAQHSLIHFVQKPLSTPSLQQYINDDDDDDDDFDVDSKNSN